MLKGIILISLVFIILITIGSTINIVRRIKIDKKIEYLVDEANPISSTNCRMNLNNEFILQLELQFIMYLEYTYFIIKIIVNIILVNLKQ